MNPIPKLIPRLNPKKPPKISSLQLNGPQMGTLTTSSRNKTLLNITQYKKAEAGKISSIQASARLVPHVKTVNNLLSKQRRNSLQVIPSSSLRIEKPHECLVFTVEIEENYGDPGYVNLSSLLFLSKDRQVIEPLKILSIPELPKDELFSLCDEKMAKSTYLNAPLDKEVNGGKITIVVHINADLNPSFVRIWNARENQSANAKIITITCTNIICFHGEIPKGFGVDVPISGFKGVSANESNRILFDLFPNLAPEPFIKDSYGEFPIFTTKNVTIDVISTYGSPKITGIGLCGIEFYSSRNEILKSDNINRFNVNGCKSIYGTEQLFKQNNFSNDWKDMFTAEVVDWAATNPSFEIAFRNPIRIVKISIYNFNSCDRDLNVCVKHIRLRFNNRIVYSGDLVKGNGLSTSNFKTDVWFCDIPEVRKEINMMTM